MSLVTLLTDFGSASPYPGQMKGVLRTLCRAAIVDLTHEVPAHDIACGAYMLAAAVRAFPAGTIHLAVVDPGVGTSRLPLAIASGGQVFVGPDNGLLMVAARALGTPRAHAIVVDRFALRPLSATFHGRDLFAPAAAAIARGLAVEQVGPPVPAPCVLPEHPPTREGGVLRGQVRYRDPFGNIITNIPAGWLDDLVGPLVIESAGGREAVRRVITYGDGARGDLLILAGSDGTVEIAVRCGRAADLLGLGPGDLVLVRAMSG
jgi:S-adenosylmethionine hydrolase